jgi:predicted permease
MKQSINMKWRRLFRLEETKRQLDRNIDEELEHHLAYRVEQLMATGMTEEEARRESQLLFGDVAGVRDDLERSGRAGMRRRRLGAALFDHLLDARLAGRRLLRSPGISLAAIASIALGIGANATIFSFLNAFLFRPLPIEDPGRLLSVHTSQGESTYGSTSYPDYRDLKERNNIFEGLAAHSFGVVNLEGRAGPRVALTQMVSWDFFQVLGVEMAAGRDFLPEEDETPGTHPVAILSHRVWRGQFGADLSVLGETIYLNGHHFTVIGVAQKGFTGLSVIVKPELWTPLMTVGQVFPYPVNLNGRIDPWLNLVGRLQPEVSKDQVAAALDVIGADLAEAYPNLNQAKRFTAVEANRTRISHTDTTDATAAFGALLMAAVGLVLLIACLNVANLNLAGAIRRQKEIALRHSLGASRGRVVRQLLIESILLSLVAGVAGLVLSVWATRAIWAMQPFSEVPLSVDLGPDGLVLGFTLALSILTGTFFGLAPALNLLRRKHFATLRVQSSTLGRTPRTSRLQSVLVTGQIAVSLVLLITTGLFVRSMQNTLAVDPGFAVREAVIAPLNLGFGQYTEEQGRRFFTEIRDRVGALPGVHGVTVSTALPLGQMHGHHDVEIDGYEPAPDEYMIFKRNAVGPGYFETMGIPIVRGRAIDARDQADSQPVAVVNEAMASRFWADGDPIGRTIRADLGVPRVVVGVMKDGKYRSLSEPTEPYLCIPMSQAPYVQRRYLLARTSGDPVAAVSPVGILIRELNPNLPLTVMTMEQYLAMNAESSRLPVFLLGGLSLLALTLALLGVYGVMSYLVSQRTQEFGIRVALGANRGTIIRRVVRLGLRTAVIGIVIGVLLALAAGQALSGFLFEVRPADPGVFALAGGLFYVVALWASYIPARWAARVSPMEALRVD